MQITSDQVLAAAVGKAIAENVTPELTAEVFTEAFRSFMDKPISTYGSDKTTRAADTLHAALKAVLHQRAEAYLEQPEQRALIDSCIAEIFQKLLATGAVQERIRDAMSRAFDNIQLR